MKSTSKVLLAFFAGGVIFNATNVFSNMSPNQDILASAIAVAVDRVNKLEEEREKEQLAKLPNILDCQNMEWMQNCSEVNDNAKRNPTAPVRIQNSKGLEFNFVPGTPSAVIRLQLEQSPEAASAAVQYMDETWGEYKQAAQLYQNAMWEAGPMDNIIGLDKAMELKNAPKDIDVAALAISVFTHSQCGACEVQLSTLGKMQERYPNLKITVFQFDDNPDGFNNKVTRNGLRGRILRPAEAASALKSGVDKWPTIWIDNRSSETRDRLSGVRSIVQIEERLLAMTHINSASK